MAFIVRIDKPGQNNHPHPNPRAVGYDVTALGSLVLMTKSPSEFFNYIPLKTNFRVYETASSRVHVYLGTITVSKGTTPQLFDRGNYLHQRHALLGAFGEIGEDDFKVGVHGHRLPLGRYGSKIQKVTDIIADPAKLMKPVIVKKYHFLAFTDSEKHHLFHGDEQKVWANSMYNESEITLGRVGHRYGASWR